MKRRGFTLVELLVVMMIMAILASIVLFALASVTEDAKRMKTVATIQKLNALIMQKYESYSTRRVPVDINAVAAYYKTLMPGSGADKNRSIKSTAPDAQAFAYARLSILRDLMRLEMPDGFLDIKDGPATETAANTPMQRPAVSTAYLNALPSNTSTSTNVSAKCLYLIVTKGLGDPDVLEQFAGNEIETDTADGLKYFIDGWGTPIYFLRWAPALTTPLQPSKDGFDPFDGLNVSEGMLVKAQAENTFPLFPLIYSAGPDKKYGISVDFKGQSAIHMKDYNNDPFYVDPSDSTVSIADFVGKADGDTSVDDITNHSE